MTPGGGSTGLFEAGDPTFLGWFTFAAYLVAAVLAWRAWRVCRSNALLLRNRDAREARRQHRLAIWWLGMAVLMTLLGLNKELDLQRLVGEWGKAAALSQGWYEDRRTVQRAFIALLLLLSTASVAAALIALRDVWGRIALPFAGLALILAYVLTRAAAIHVLRGAVPESVTSSLWLLELLGIALVLWCASRAARSTGARRP